MKRLNKCQLIFSFAAGAAIAAMATGCVIRYRKSDSSKKPPDRTRDAVRIGIPLAKVFMQHEEAVCGDIHITVTGTELVKEQFEMDSMFRIWLRLENKGVKPYTYRKQHFQRQDSDFDMFEETGSTGAADDTVLVRTGEALDEVLSFGIREGTESFMLIYMNEHSKPVGIDFVL
jgi:hypothetical protein